MKRSEKYTAALRQLDQMREDGRVDQASYDVKRQALLAEASQPQRSLAVKIILFVLIVAVIVVIINLLGRGMS